MIKPRRVLFVMPVTVNSMAARAPARAWTRRISEPQCGRLPALPGEGGPGDPLDDWTHKCRALADCLSFQQAGVDRTRLILQLWQVLQLAVAAQVPGVVDDGLDAQRDAVLQVLLQPGIPVEHVEGDQVAVPVDLGLEAAAGGREGRPPEPLAAAETARRSPGGPGPCSRTAAPRRTRGRGHRCRRPGCGRFRSAASTAPTSTRRPGRRQSAGAGSGPSTARTIPARCRGRSGRRWPAGRPGRRRRRTRWTAR